MSKRTRNSKAPKTYAKKITPLKKNTAQALFFLNAILWFLYAVYIILDMSAIKNNAFSITIVGFFVLLNASAILAAGILIKRTYKWVYYFAAGITVLNILLTLTDLTSFFYMSAFIIDLLILWALYSLRHSYLPNP